MDTGRLSKAAGDAAWAVVKTQADAGSDTAEERIEKAAEAISKSLLAIVQKEFDESSVQRDEHGKFTGMSAGAATNLRNRIATIRATMPESEHAHHIAAAVARTRQRMASAAAARAALNAPEARARSNARSAETRARNRAAAAEAERAASARPPEAHEAEAATAHNTPMEAQVASDVVPPVQGAASVASPPPTPVVDAHEQQRSLPGMAEDGRAESLRQREQEIASDSEQVGSAITYFHDLAGARRNMDMSAVSPELRTRLVAAGVLEPRGSSPSSGHQLTAAGRDLAGRGLSAGGIGVRVREREASIARGETPAPPPPPPESDYDRRARERREARERDDQAAAQRRREAAEAAARAPGGAPTNPIIPTKDASGRVVKAPGGTCAADTYGKRDGTYVLREKSDHKVTEVAPVKLNMVDTPENMRGVFGPKMPDTESLEKVWGHEEGGITCKVTSTSPSNRAVRFEGKILKKDPQAPGGQREIGRFTRSFTRDSAGKVTAGHDYFKIAKADDQGGGLGANMIGHAFHAYREMGVDKITVHPAWVGPYAWASFGYDVSKSEISDLQSRLVPFLKGHGITDARAREVAGQCDHLHHFADLDLSPDGKDAGKGNPGLAIHHISDEVNRDGSHPEYDLHLGAKFLLGPGVWSEGTIELSNPRSASFERVKSRLGVK